nr:hypothetical protein [uncultured Campylobacter sp.]
MAVAASLSQVYATNSRKRKTARRSNISARAAIFIRSLVKLNANDRGRSAMDIFRVKDGKIVEYQDIVQGIPKKRKRRYCVLNLARFRAKSSVKFVKNPNLVTDSPKERVKFKPKLKADIFALNANLSRLCLIFAARLI